MKISNLDFAGDITSVRVTAAKVGLHLNAKKTEAIIYKKIKTTSTDKATRKSIQSRVLKTSIPRSVDLKRISNAVKKACLVYNELFLK